MIYIQYGIVALVCSFWLNLASIPKSTFIKMGLRLKVIYFYKVES